MATAQSSEEEITCSICYEQLQKPRKLPGCGHKFCEKCLLTFIDNLISNNSNLSKFQCPNCRVEVTLPKTKDELNDWVKSLDVSSDQTMTDTSGRAGNVCSACKNVEISVPAEKYCLDCQESLCSKCARISHGLKQLTGHSIVDLKQATEGLGESGDESLLFIMASYMKCNTHPENPLLYICKDDHTLCCTDCILDIHRHCDNIANLKDKSVKEEVDTKANKLKEQKDRIASQVKLLMDFKKAHAAEIKLKSGEISDKIREVRTKVSAIFDVVEENIVSNARAIAKTCCIEVEEEMTKLSNFIKTLEEQDKVIRCFEKVGSFSQRYIVVDKIKQKQDEIEHKFLNIAKESRVFEVELKLETALEAFVSLDQNNTDQLASVKEKTQPVPVLQITQSQKEGILTKVDDYEIMTVSKCYNQEYYSMIYRIKQRCLFLVSRCSGHECCCLTDETYKTIKCIEKSELSGKPYNATNLKTGEIAISLPENKKICFLSERNETNELRINGSINTKYTPKSLYGLQNGNIAVSWNDPVAFGMLQFSCHLYGFCFKELKYFKNDSAGRRLKTFDFMTVDEKRNNVIQLCTEDKAVYCFDFEGNPKFKYTHEDLVYPRGVSISGDGNVFVCDKEKSVIHVISPEGQGLHVLKEGCPEKPLAIAFDESGSQFAVSQSCDPLKFIRIFRLV